MNQPAETLQLSQEEQGRLLARVYAFILSDQFTGAQKEINTVETDQKTSKNNKNHRHVTSQEIDAQLVQTQESTQ
ncbi:MAG: hypothetical protein BGO78_17015 [Chloroflexi bacterium 44-23]|nr:MAG: hypothetical protein BGO78_17015 [Chloroflexi bacterium 44-23]